MRRVGQREALSEPEGAHINCCSSVEHCIHRIVLEAHLDMVHEVPRDVLLLLNVIDPVKIEARRVDVAEDRRGQVYIEV